MQCRSNIPNCITLFRLIVAPIFFYTFLNDFHLISVVLLIFAFSSDALDGYIARKIGATSNKGAYLDVISDFILIITCFLAYVVPGWYDPLIMVLIIIMFLLFVATSGLKKPVYDPLGKYLGSYLMLMIFLTLLFPDPLIRQILVILLLFICLTSVITRFFFFIRKSHPS